MPAVQQPEHQLIAGALANSFDRWATNHERFGKLYVKMPREVLTIIRTGLGEVEALNPISWDVWWLKEHNRFRKDGIRQDDKRYITQLMHAFLADFHRGKVDTSDNNKRSKSRRRRKAATSDERSN